MEMGQVWLRRTKSLMLRAAMVRHGNIQVKSPSTREEPVSNQSNHVNNS